MAASLSRVRRALVVHGIDRLWGGVIRSFAVDLLAPALTLVVEVVESGAAQTCRLTFSGLRGLHLLREPPTGWDYAELTSIEASREGETWRVVMELWSSETTVEILCESVTLGPTEGQAEPGAAEVTGEVKSRRRW